MDRAFTVIVCDYDFAWLMFLRWRWSDLSRRRQKRRSGFLADTVQRKSSSPLLNRHFLSHKNTGRTDVLISISSSTVFGESQGHLYPQSDPRTSSRRHLTGGRRRGARNAGLQRRRSSLSDQGSSDNRKHWTSPTSIFVRFLKRGFGSSWKTARTTLSDQDHRLSGQGPGRNHPGQQW